MMDEKNDKENGEETKGKLFQKGGKPGPGRGHKAPIKPLTLEELEAYLQSDLKSKDAKIRHTAMRLYLMLKKQMISNEPVAVNPELAAMQAHIAGKLFDDSDIQEVQEDEFFD